jgi:hypothetical protein
MVINPRSVSLWLAAIIAGLLVAYLAGQYLHLSLGYRHALGFVPLFDLNKEGNIPALYSTLLLLLASVLLLTVGLHERGAGHRYARHWLGLALIFLFLAIDENTALHERLGAPTELVMRPEGVLAWAPWVIPYSLLVITFAGMYLRFLLHLPAPTRRAFVVAGVLYVTGAIGMELVGALHHELSGPGHDVFYVLTITVEEGLEMIAMVVFSHAIMTYIGRAAPELRIGFAQVKADPQLGLCQPPTQPANSESISERSQVPAR